MLSRFCFAFLGENMKTKICRTCKQEFPATTEYFYARGSKRVGLRSHCKSCYHKLDKPRKVYIYEECSHEDMRSCGICKQEFPATLEHFYRSKNRRDGLDAYCKGCRDKKARAWEKAHPERIKIRNVKYAEYQRNWALEHVDYMRDAIRLSNFKRRKSKKALRRHKPIVKD